MLRALDRAKNPDAETERPVALRGFSWIVSPFETGGVVIALEMSLGAVIAGPFDIPERDLNAMIERVMRPDRATAETIHRLDFRWSAQGQRCSTEPVAVVRSRDVRIVRGGEWPTAGGAGNAAGCGQARRLTDWYEGVGPSTSAYSIRGRSE